MDEPTLYDILQVSPAAEPGVIEAAYRRLAQMYHPDVNRDPGSSERMKRINAAYNVLRDAGRRKRYDTELRQRAAPRIPPESRMSPPAGSNAPTIARGMEIPVVPRPVERAGDSPRAQSPQPDTTEPIARVERPAAASEVDTQPSPRPGRATRSWYQPAGWWLFVLPVVGVLGMAVFALAGTPGRSSGSGSSGGGTPTAGPGAVAKPGASTTALAQAPIARSTPTITSTPRPSLTPTPSPTATQTATPTLTPTPLPTATPSPVCQSLPESVQQGTEFDVVSIQLESPIRIPVVGTVVGLTTVSGRLRNNCDQTRTALVSYRLFDRNDREVDASDTPLVIEDLAPGEVRPFRFELNPAPGAVKAEIQVDRRP